MTGWRPPWLDSREPAPARRRRPPPPRATRDLVLRRAGGCCESCGAPLEPGRWELHHRRPRGMGGTRAEVAHAIENLLALCLPCHGAVHGHPGAARDAGLLLHQAADPARVPVRLPGGRVVLLGPDGTYVEEQAG